MLDTKYGNDLLFYKNYNKNENLNIKALVVFKFH